MSVQLANNATSKLAAGLSSGATSLAVLPGEGAKFPTLNAGDWFPLTIVKVDGTLEIVKCTARSSDTFTIERAQEGTAAEEFQAGDRVELRATKLALETLARDANADHPGPDEPLVTWPYMKWADTTDELLKRRNAANTDWMVEGALFFDNRIRMARFGSSGTFVVPDGVTRVWVTLCGGGGGGGAYSNSTAGGSGGGGAAGAIRTPVDVTPGESITVTVGSGGAGGNAAGADGAAGGTSSFGAYLSTPGGGAGRAANAGGAGGAGGGAIMAGRAGQQYNPAGNQSGGAGGSSPLGVGGEFTPSASGGGQFGSGYGSGGGGGANGVGRGGQNGIVIVEW